jgi:hypothetical protein
MEVVVPTPRKVITLLLKLEEVCQVLRQLDLKRFGPTQRQAIIAARVEGEKFPLLVQKMKDLRDVRQAALGTVAGKDAVAIGRLYTLVETGYRYAHEKWFQAVFDRRYDPTLKKDAESYEQIVNAWTKLGRRCDEVIADIDKLYGLYASIETKAQEANQELGRQRDLLVELERSNKAIEIERFKRLDAAFQVKASGQLKTAEALICARMYSEALQLLKDLDEKRETLQQATDNLPDRRDLLRSKRADTMKQWYAARTMLERAESAIRTMTDKSDDTQQWEPVSLQLEEARASHVEAHFKLEMARSALWMKSQKWDKAEQLLTEVNKTLVDIVKLCRTVHEQYQKIKQICENAPRNLVTLEVAIAQAIVLVESLAGEQDVHRATLEVTRDVDLPVLLGASAAGDYKDFTSKLHEVSRSLRCTVWTATCQHNSSVDQTQSAFVTFRAPTFAYDRRNDVLTGALADASLRTYHLHVAEAGTDLEKPLDLGEHANSNVASNDK